MTVAAPDLTSTLPTGLNFTATPPGGNADNTPVFDAVSGSMPGLTSSIKDSASGSQTSLPGESDLASLIDQGNQEGTAFVQQTGQQTDLAMQQDQAQVQAGAAAMQSGSGYTGQASNGKASDGTRIPQADDKRPDGDTRSVQQIMDDNPVLKNLGNQSGDRDALKKQVGDFDTDPDAAYRAAEVLNYIKSSNASDGTARGSDVTQDGKIEGFTKDGDARHGTEAGELQDFDKNGYSQLTNDNHDLQTTDDTHVNKDGTNKDNFQWGMEQVGNVFKSIVSMIPGVNMIAGLFGG
jgi:hypothetical protein